MGAMSFPETSLPGSNQIKPYNPIPNIYISQISLTQLQANQKAVLEVTFLEMTRHHYRLRSRQLEMTAVILWRFSSSLKAITCIICD